MNRLRPEPTQPAGTRAGIGISVQVSRNQILSIHFEILVPVWRIRSFLLWETQIFKLAARGPQNGRRGLGFWVLPSTLAKLFFYLSTPSMRKITSRTTGARGYEFELFRSIFNYIEQSCRSLLSILLYLGLSRTIWNISVYLGASW